MTRYIGEFVNTLTNLVYSKIHPSGLPLAWELNAKKRSRLRHLWYPQPWPEKRCQRFPSHSILGLDGCWNMFRCFSWKSQVPYSDE